MPQSYEYPWQKSKADKLERQRELDKMQKSFDLNQLAKIADENRAKSEAIDKEISAQKSLASILQPRKIADGVYEDPMVTAALELNRAKSAGVLGNAAKADQIMGGRSLDPAIGAAAAEAQLTGAQADASLNKYNKDYRDALSGSTKAGAENLKGAVESEKLQGLLPKAASLASTGADADIAKNEGDYITAKTVKDYAAELAGAKARRAISDNVVNTYSAPQELAKASMLDKMSEFGLSTERNKAMTADVAGWSKLPAGQRIPISMGGRATPLRDITGRTYYQDSLEGETVQPGYDMSGFSPGSTATQDKERRVKIGASQLEGRDIKLGGK